MLHFSYDTIVLYFYRSVWTYKLTTNCTKIEPDAEMRKLAHSTVAKIFRNETLVGASPHELWAKEAITPPT